MTDTSLNASGAAVGRSGRVALWLRRLPRTVAPVVTVVAALIALWYVACIPMNAQESLLAAERAGAEVTPATAAERRGVGGVSLAIANPAAALSGALGQERPRLPAPHQIVAELWQTTAGHLDGCGLAEEERDRLVIPLPFLPGDPVSGEARAISTPIDEDCADIFTSRRSLVFHAGLTLAPTLLGFAIGSALGILLAVGIVHSRVMDLSVMPWAIASQTIPILAIAPMIIVVFNSVGIQGLLPKSIISAYLSFFPVTVGMVKGLRAPSPADLDLMRTWNASGLRTLISLRLPTSLPYLFASLKVAIAAALVGAIIGELPTGAVRGLGARLLAGSYYGQTIQIWSALFGAAIVAALLVATLSMIERATLKQMGLQR
ncbi:ABC transporter permease [Jannaschia aquimarina]|uniref:SsuC_1 protein n=1 Tax=Jannaschia aquimarina TaxID=935700 RepID=A0A0D1EML6_9RHOB|nr:ABC transporter permease subunit [Jannaschia aquimarina]KIT16945.1 putative aliphatic sulfonates transport permease protein SsuC [Jannaschia aquimarina]SNT11036.1 NitT/TauT family transport system permease protein [Jannaschia aquimarina]